MKNKILSKIIFIAVLTFILFSFNSAYACDVHKHRYNLTYFESPIHHRQHDEITVQLDEGDIIFVNHDEDHSTVEITEDYRLIIDDEEIELNDQQQKLVKQFYDQSMDIKKYAKEIGLEGARVGLDGVKVGLKAIGCVFKLLSPEYDTDDLEYEVEQAARNVERKARKLEIKANRIEYMVDDLAEYADEMVLNIPELDELGWF